MIKYLTGRSYGPWLGSLAVMCLIGLGWAQQNEIVDSDNDGMSDAYELFFGLNPTNSACANDQILAYERG